MPTVLVDKMMEGLKGLLVPGQDYFDGKFQTINAKMQERLGIDMQIFEDLKNLDPTSLKDIKITIMGTTATIVNMQHLTTVIGELRIWIKGFLFLALFFYNVNNVHKLVRGVSIFNPTPVPNNDRGMG